jgi:RNA polymerase primary sigma factor
MRRAGMFSSPRVFLLRFPLQLLPSRSPELDRGFELHFSRLAETPLLTHEGEIALARRIERADLAIVRALLASARGRRALAEVARALREKRTRIEDAVRNPADEIEELAMRIERVVAEAAKRPRGSRTRPPAGGIRLNPRAVRAIEVELEAEGEDVREIVRRRRDGEIATAEFVQANLRIVITFARRYRGMPLVDLVQEGNLGLLRAVDKFDHRRGLRFSTYAAWWIRHALQRALADQSKMIRLPVHLTGAIARVRRAQERVLREMGREATPDEIAARTGLPMAHVRRALDVVAQPVSLDAPSGGDASQEVYDHVADESARSVDDLVAERELRADTTALLAILPEREAEVIRLRYGVGGGRQRTLEEVGKRLRVSRERARQIERDALAKLRAVSEERELREHIEP